ncbi:hypothetical protein LINPERHAP2_LOCUS9744 [Linum perenne]
MEGSEQWKNEVEQWIQQGVEYVAQVSEIQHGIEYVGRVPIIQQGIEYASQISPAQLYSASAVLVSTILLFILMSEFTLCNLTSSA